MCAIGRVLKFPEKLTGHQGKSFYVLTCENIISDEDFKEEYQGLPLDFWCNLQDVHDSAAHDGYYSIKNNLRNIGSRGHDFFVHLNKFIENYEEEA